MLVVLALAALAVLGLALLAEAARAGASRPGRPAARPREAEAAGGAGADRPAAASSASSFPTPSAGIWRSGSISTRPERTTEEFLYELQGTNLLTPDQKESLGEFLKRCDLVKFAKYEPGEPELRDLHDSAVRLVEETEPDSMAPTLQDASKRTRVAIRTA